MTTLFHRHRDINPPFPKKRQTSLLIVTVPLGTSKTFYVYILIGDGEGLESPREALWNSRVFTIQVVGPGEKGATYTRPLI